MDIQITIDDDLLDTIGSYLKYSATIEDDKHELIENPESQDDFIERKIREYPENCYSSGRSDIDKAGKSARLSYLDTQLAKITSKQI